MNESINREILASHPYSAQYLDQPVAEVKYLVIEDGGATSVALCLDQRGHWLEDRQDVCWAENFLPGRLEFVEDLVPCAPDLVEIAGSYRKLEERLPNGLQYVSQSQKGHILYAPDRQRFYLVPEDEQLAWVNDSTLATLKTDRAPNTPLGPVLLVVREDGCAMEGC